MSHFTVLVIGEHPEEQLAPYHEFECTGIDNQYVKNIDITEEARELYNTETEKMHRNSNGEMVPSWDDIFFRDPTEEELKKIGPVGGFGCGNGFSWASKDWEDGKGYRTKIRYLPPGWEEVEVKVSELKDFVTFAKEYYGFNVTRFPDTNNKNKYGYILITDNNVRVINRTNPNAKWDWYKLGGRWTGFFKLKSGHSGKVGKPGTLTKAAKSGYADQAFVKDIDFEEMRLEEERKSTEEFDYYKPAFYGKELPSWNEIRDKYSVENIDKAREEHRNHPVVKEINRLAAEKNTHVMGDVREYFYNGNREKFISSRREKAISTFAVVKDGKWYERGKMGLWACVSEEKEQFDWLKEFNKLLDGLDENTLLSVFDCHI